MTNSYADLTTFKSSGVLNITATGYDTRLRELLETISRFIDRYCNRHFYILVETRKFDGDGSAKLNVPDLISVTTLKSDDNKDRTFETTWAATDYLLYPTNASPSKVWGRPYTRVLVDVEAGSKSSFPAGMQALEINGKWGFREVTEDSAADINEGAQFSATDTTLTVTDGSKFAVGQTMLIESEQLYITAISTNDLTVTRGVNGTTAAAHNDGKDISIYRYPASIAQACLIQASRIWKRKDSGFSTRVGLRQTGVVDTFRELDPDVQQFLSAYRKAAGGGRYMVAPTAGKLKEIIDDIATQLDAVDDLRVYKYPTDSVQEYPAAIIRDNHSSNQTSLAEYRSTTPETVYHLEVLILVALADESEAYDELEKYVSADSPSSVKSLMENVTTTGVQTVECTRAEPRRRYSFGGASLWGCSFWVRNIVT